MTVQAVVSLTSNFEKGAADVKRRWTDRRWLLTTCLAAGGATGGCTHNIKVEPIYMTLEIRIKVERELNEFFAFEDRLREQPPMADTQPAAPTTAPQLPPPASEGGAQ
jgi:hypothetical protein